MHSLVSAIQPPIFTSPRPDPQVLLGAIRRPDHRKAESGGGGKVYTGIVRTGYGSQGLSEKTEGKGRQTRCAYV